MPRLENDSAQPADPGPESVATPAAIPEEEEDDFGVTGLPSGVAEEEIPADLLAELIMVNDKDIKPVTRQDHARRCSKYYQFLLARFGGQGCHPVDGRPSPLPDKCLPSARGKKPHPNFIDYKNINASHFSAFLCSIRKGKKGEVDLSTNTDSPGQRLSHGDVRKYKDALCHHLVQQEVPPQALPA